MLALSDLTAIGIMVALMGGLFGMVPGGFVPEEDQGYFLVNIQLPDAASQGRTAEVLKQLDKIVAETPGVADFFIGTTRLGTDRTFPAAPVVHTIGSPLAMASVRTMP